MIICKDDPNSLAHHLGFNMGGEPPLSSGRTTVCLFPSDQRVSEMGRSASDEVKGREVDIYIYICMVTYLWSGICYI